MTRRTFEAYERWASTYDSDPNPQTALEETDVLELLGASGRSQVLDAACGTGRYIGQLVARGARVIGFDLSRAMLDKAYARHPHIPLVRADLETGLPFADGIFSHVLCTQTLKHCPTLEEPLREFARVLEPRGVLVFSVTHPEMDFSGYEMRETPRFILSEEADIFHHSMDDYQTALSTAGFTVDDVRAVRVSAAIASYLTDNSFQLVPGRPQVAVVRAHRT